jgi:alpha-beta hydrolase superfamily lysophospholipase
MQLKQKLAITYIRTKFKVLSLISKTKTAEKAFELFCTPLMKSPHRLRTVFSWAENLDFKMNGSTIRGYRWNSDKPNKVLILHGFGSAAHKFSSYIVALVDKGYQVLAFDAPAHGNSEGRTVNAMQYCEMIEEIVSLYGPVNGFLAHSFGGIALSLAMEKMTHDQNTKIVLVAPATETTSAIDSAFKFLQINDETVRMEFDRLIFNKSGHAPKWYSIKRAMKNIKANILWIHDEDDEVTPLKDALLVKEESFHNIQFVITKGLGHQRIYKDAAIKNRIVQFL